VSDQRLLYRLLSGGLTSVWRLIPAGHRDPTRGAV